MTFEEEAQYEAYARDMGITVEEAREHLGAARVAEKIHYALHGRSREFLLELTRQFTDRELLSAQAYVLAVMRERAGL